MAEQRRTVRLSDSWRDALRSQPRELLSSTTKLVGHTVATYANAEGEAWPSRVTIAAGASLGLRATETALNELEDEGWLEIEPKRQLVTLVDKAGETSQVLRRVARAGQVNHYRLTFPTAHDVRSQQRTSRRATAHLTTRNSARGALKPGLNLKENLSLGEAELDEAIELARARADAA